uniref:Uncharacterized protein n=2 Tax=Ixodes scapularis TaxID=6945 RepID=A0A1S4KXE2_IXOSC
IEECSETKDDCQWSCLNTQGGYLCQCPVGFKLHQDNKSCVDVNECRTSNGGCQEGCVNLIGSFRCKCTTAGSSLAADGKKCECKYGNV